MIYIRRLMIYITFPVVWGRNIYIPPDLPIFRVFEGARPPEIFPSALQKGA